MKKHVRSKTLYYKKTPMLVAISNTIKSPNKHHKVVYLVNTKGLKIHTYDDISIKDDKGKSVIKHSVTCYPDFFVIDKADRKPSLLDINTSQTNHYFIVLSYDGSLLCSESGKWSEAKHLIKTNLIFKERNSEINL